MKHTLKFFCSLIALASMITMTACGASDADNNVITISNGEIIYAPEDTVPDKATLSKNLEDAGYTITEYTSMDGSDLTIDRVIAKKGSKFIDITYCSSEEEANTLFATYCDKYKADDDYYILAQNETFVYCVSDKKTFSKAGFTSTGNIGIQYIND